MPDGEGRLGARRGVGKTERNEAMSVKHFETDDQLSQAIESYFSTRDKDNPPTISGLALHLGFVSRQSFYDYEKNPAHSYTIKRARLAIEDCYEQRLHASNPTGAIFALKNFGWKDTQEITGKDGGPLVSSVVFEIVRSTDKVTDKA